MYKIYGVILLGSVSVILLGSPKKLSKWGFKEDLHLVASKIKPADKMRKM